ncbi:MAG: 4-amino-4-deoxy-L-arabinose transferase, partial [Spirochaetales bacterium]|nr:4-amino-4-deoxy-L-arabinose transferase [Spirochaetales bacterium]
MKQQKTSILFLYLVIWFVSSLFFLTDYPFVHSDEPWLSGLTRSMMDSSSLSSTEDFFDLYERNPHALKVLFHLLQMPFIRLLGYSLFSVRLLSLTAGLISLY